MPKGPVDSTISFSGDVDSDSWGLNISFFACQLEGMPGLPPHPAVAGVVIRRARPEERLRRNQPMAERHQFGFLRLVGRRLRYVAVLGTLWPGLAGTRAEVPYARSLHSRKPSQQDERLHLVASNTHQLLLPEPGAVPNLGSCPVVGILRRLSDDWKAVIRWNWRRPSRIRKSTTGRCTDLEPGTGGAHQGLRARPGRLHGSAWQTEGDVSARPPSVSQLRCLQI